MRSRVLVLSAALLMVVPMAATATSGEPPYVSTDVLTASDGAPMDLFGGYRGGLDASQDVIVVAAMHDDTPVTDAGAVYSYYRTPLGWKQQKLVSPSPVVGGEFGRSVVLGSSSPYAERPDRLAIGAWREGDGRVHLYRLMSNGTWRYDSTLAGCCEFGMDVAMSGRTLVIGTRYTDRADVYVENPSGAWVKQSSLAPPEPGGAAHFGTAVAVNVTDGGNWIAVGDYAVGAVYLFEGSADSWTFRQRLDAPPESFRFGASLDLNDTWLVVGAPRSGYPDQRGSAYMYEKVGGVWVFDGDLTPPDLPTASYFGADVDLSWGPRVAVGAPQAEIGYPTGGPGEVFVYTTSDSGWDLADRVRAPGGRNGDGFGEGVAVAAGGYLVAGAPYRDDGRGAAYRFWGDPEMQRVLFVTSSPDRLPKPDRLMVGRLRANYYEVVLVDDDAPVPDTAPAVDAILISSSVVHAKVGAKYRDVPIPVVTWEPYLFDDLGFTSGQPGDQGETSRTYTRVFDSAPMNSGYETGGPVTTAPMRLSFGRPKGDVRIYATVPGEQWKAVMFGYDKGWSMAAGRTAPQRRFGLFLTYPTPETLTGSRWTHDYWPDKLWFTDGGWGRVDAALECAIGGGKGGMDLVQEWECFGEPGSGPPT